MTKNHDWILAVFDDIYTYAKKNNLPVIAEETKRKRKIAEWEIDAKQKTNSQVTSALTVH